MRRVFTSVTIAFRVGTQWLTSGPVHLPKETTTSFTATPKNKRFQSLRDYRNGTRKCWTKAWSKGSCSITKLVAMI